MVKIKKNKRRIGIYILIFILFFLLLISTLLLIRQLNFRQVDDFSPQIFCEKNIIDNSEVLAVIPLFNNVSIAKNKTFCEETLRLNKTLIMHGVYHVYNEFSESRDETYVFLGMEEFKKCFGYYPKVFEAPQLALSKENKKMLEGMGFEVWNYKYQLFHKVYHCSDTGLFSNRFVEFV